MPELRVNNKLWCISDTHFGHKNIVKYCQRPESHEVMMLSHWIELVGEHDQLLHFGDVFLGKQGSPKRWARVISRLPGEKFLMWGNHDHESLRTYEELAGFTIVPEFIHNGVFFSHRPASVEYPPPHDDWHTNIHGHVHNNEYNQKHDGTYFEGKNYINISIEVMDFKPRQLGGIWPIDR